MIKSAICCIAKNEDNYLKEWCDYHLKLGFEKIYIFQNNWRYKNNDINDERVELIPFDYNHALTPCYNNFINIMHDKIEYALFIDCDEFLVIRNGMRLNEYLDSISNYDVIYINWRVFGDNGLKEVTDNNYSQLKRFTKCDNKLHRLGKCLINLKRTGESIIYNNPHIVIMNSPNIAFPVVLDSNGNKFDTPHPWDAHNYRQETVELFHYRNKTYQERKNKHGPGTLDAYWKNNPYDNEQYFDDTFDEYNTNVVEDITARKFMYGY